MQSRRSNSRWSKRSFNSAVELVGEPVEISSNSGETVSTVDSVTVSSDGETTLSTESGDSVTLTEYETNELLSEGEVIEPENTEFEVTREVTDAAGDTVEVTTKVEAENEDDAIDSVKLLDSRRNRNSRNYRIGTKMNSRKRNSRKLNSAIPPFTIYIGDESYEINDAVSQGDYIGADSFGDITEDPELIKLLESGEVTSLRWSDENAYGGGEYPQVETNCDTKKNSREFKVVRKITSNGRVVRKVASVTAPSLEEAIAAVETKDKSDDIQADGYEELVEEEPKESVMINSDTEIREETEAPIDVPKVEEVENPTEETVAEPTESALGESTDPKSDLVEDETTQEEIDRTTNSYKGVSDFVKRKYGYNL